MAGSQETKKQESNEKTKDQDILDAVIELTKQVGSLAKTVEGFRKEFEKWQKAGKF